MLEFNNLIIRITSQLERNNFTTQDIQNILFLIDWRAALSEKPSISNLEWEIGLNGAYSKNLHEKFKQDSKLINLEDGEQIKVNIDQRTDISPLATWQESVIYFTISKIKKLKKSDFDNLIKSLFPMKLEKFSPINLTKIAKDYLNSGVSIEKIKFD